MLKLRKLKKKSGKEKILIKSADEKAYQQVSKQQLHQQLKKFKDTYKDALYVKIIIPDNSGLSYNEAWSFMSGLLDKYDYYYQDWGDTEYALSIYPGMING